MADTIQVTARIRPSVHAAIVELAKQDTSHVVPQQTGDYVASILTRVALESNHMDLDEEERIRAEEEVLRLAQWKAVELRDNGRFNEHFTLTVIRAMMQDPDIRKTYETAVGGDAYINGLKGKMPLNMYLGWSIKNAVGAEVQKNEAGKPRRTTVRGEPIQTYTLLDPNSI